MKCVQRSCQRTKNILDNGYCNVCNEAVKETTAKFVEKNKTNDIDLKDLLTIHEKIVQELSIRILSMD